MLGAFREQYCFDKMSPPLVHKNFHTGALRDVSFSISTPASLESGS